MRKVDFLILVGVSAFVIGTGWCLLRVLYLAWKMVNG